MRDLLAGILERGSIFDFNSIVVRGSDIESTSTSDIDVLVNHGQANHACLQFMEYLRSKGWLLLSFRQLDYLSSIVVTNTELFPNRSTKIDFFSGLGWYGVERESAKFTAFRNADTHVQMAAITLVHKIMYAGGLADKDFIRVGGHFNEAVALFNLERLGVSKTLVASRMSPILKWKVRFVLSGYPVRALPIWVSEILNRAVRSKIFLTRSKGMEVIIVGSGNFPQSVCDDLLDMYKSSGDSSLPRFDIPFFKRINVLRSKAFELSKKNYSFGLILKPVSILINSIQMVVRRFLKARGHFFITVLNNKPLSVMADSETYMIDVSDVEPDEVQTFVLYRIDEIFYEILKEKSRSSL